ncbi:MAG: hypothetical protein ACE145_18670 [Terriglobia bacterium]
MKGSAWRSGLVFGFLITTSSGFLVNTFALAAEHEPRIVVSLYNYARVSGETLTRAEAVATRIFARAGIQIAWEENRARDTVSQVVAHPGAVRTDVRLTMHIISRSMALRLEPTQTCLGMAVVPGARARADMAYVFFYRVEELARTRSLCATDGLGHAMAHEIGHLLLGVQSHSPMGLMRVCWDRTDLVQAATGWLIFSDQEADRIRAEIRARTGSTSTARADAHP